MSSRSPDGVTAHELHHTFTSIHFAVGKDPAHVMSQLGHAEPGFALGVYAHVMRHDNTERDRLKPS